MSAAIHIATSGGLISTAFIGTIQSPAFASVRSNRRRLPSDAVHPHLLAAGFFDSDPGYSGWMTRP
jgi:hypothetical protein